MTHLMRDSVILGCICAANCSFALAAPVTVHFDAIVDKPRQGVSAPVPPSWNFDLQQGDTISGFFTIEPFDAAANAGDTYFVQQFNFTLRIKSQAITTSQFRVHAMDDVWGYDIETPYDGITVGCSHTANAFQQWCRNRTHFSGQPGFILMVIRVSSADQTFPQI